MDTLPAKAVISEEEAFEVIATHAPAVQILEVLSDAYPDPVSSQRHQTQPVPGFYRISIDRFEEAPSWNLKSDDTMIKVLEEYAILPEAETRILLFDNIQIYCGPHQSRFDASARFYSILKYFGIRHVSIIMGNATNGHLKEKLLANATDEKFLLDSPVTPWSEDMIKRAPLGRDEFISYDTLVKMIAGELGDYRLLDARSAEEYTGKVMGYAYITAAGRIPTSESVPNGEYQLSAEDGLSDVLDRLKEALNAKGIFEDDRIIWSCGTGWRAARMRVLTQLLGFKDVAIYEGGWHEWHQRNPGCSHSARFHSGLF